MNKQRGFTIIELGGVLFFLVWLACVSAILYVAYHFISKFW
jgi:Tfp pilus assembly protein PilE